MTPNKLITNETQSLLCDICLNLKQKARHLLYKKLKELVVQREGQLIFYPLRHQVLVR